MDGEEQPEPCLVLPPLFSKSDVPFVYAFNSYQATRAKTGAAVAEPAPPKTNKRPLKSFPAGARLPPLG
jgi:hypothetical protein